MICGTCEAEHLEGKFYNHNFVESDICNYCKHSIKEHHWLDPEDEDMGCYEGLCFFKATENDICDCYYNYELKLGRPREEMHWWESLDTIKEK